MYEIIKNVLDRIVALCGIIMLIPVYLILAILVLFTSRGGIFFTQIRLGKQGKEFKIIKFRTMVLGAEMQKQGLNTTINDPRVTRVGKILRRYSLDELPQLFNVLKGDMSFVGPRPPVAYSPYFYADYPAEIKRRFGIRPGITGLAQVNGRNSLGWDEKWSYDLHYVENLGLNLDLKILYRTILIVFNREGEYDK